MYKYLDKVKKNRAPHLFFVKGDETYYHQQISKISIQHFRSIGYQIEHIDAKTTPDFIEILNSGGFFGEKKFVIVANIDKLKKSDTLEKYLKDPENDTTVLFLGASDISTHLGKILEDRCVTYVGKKFLSYKKDASRWLQEEAGRAGYIISESYATIIHQNVGDDLYALHNAIHKVILHADAKVIEKKDLSEVLSRTTTNPVYEITNIYGSRDLTKNLMLIDLLYRQNDNPSVLIVSTLMGHIEKMIHAKSLIDYGLDPKDIASVLGMSPWIYTERLVPQLKKYTLDELLKTYRDICQIDILVKSSALDKRAIIENFLIIHIGDVE